jgi:hypothetical protein
MRWSAEEHQKFINFFPKNMTYLLWIDKSQKMLDSLGGGDILKIRFWKN